MARRADHTREELKELIIQAGIRRLTQGGLAELGARKLAGDIGYTVGTLYNVFADYDDIMLHINARTLDEWYDVMLKALAKAGKTNAIPILAKTYIAFSRSHYHQWVALFEHHAKQEDLPDWYIPKMTRFFSLAEQPLLPLVNQDTKKANRAARILWAGIHGICILSLSGKLDLVKSDSPEVLALSFVDNYIAGLKKEA